jgi:hypothetical protein
MGLTNAELGLVLTTVAGSATALGAAVVFSERLVQLASKPFLAGALGLSSGVMLYVSFVEIFVKSLDGFADSSAFGDSDAYLMATAALFGGMGFMSGLDALVHWLDPNRSAHHASDPRKHMVRAAGVLFVLALELGLCVDFSRRWRRVPPIRHRRDALAASMAHELYCALVRDAIDATRNATRNAGGPRPGPGSLLRVR